MKYPNSGLGAFLNINAFCMVGRLPRPALSLHKQLCGSVKDGASYQRYFCAVYNDAWKEVSPRAIEIQEENWG